MKSDIKGRLITALITGTFFAIIMALFDLYKDKPFSMLKFIVCLILFGAFNGFFRYKTKKD